MAKYKHYDYSQGKFIPIRFDKQILPGAFEYTLHYLIDKGNHKSFSLNNTWIRFTVGDNATKKTLP
jgi:hypothetical protein